MPFRERVKRLVGNTNSLRSEDVRSSFTLKVNPESLFSESSDSSVPTVPHLGSFTGSGAVRPGA